MIKRNKRMIKTSAPNDQGKFYGRSKHLPPQMKHVPQNSDLQADLRTMGVCLLPQLLVQLVNT